DGLPRKKKREKRIKDPNAPKGPASAYILFQNDIRSAYKKEHPDMSNKELLRLIGDQWKTLAEEKKNFYRDQHGRAKKKHEVDLAAYNAQNPDHVPAEVKDSGKKKKKEEASEPPATKEIAKAAPKTTKKAAAPVRSFVSILTSADLIDQKAGKVVPKSKEVVESSGSEAEDASEVEASDAESSDDEPAPTAKAKATTDEDSDSVSEADTDSSEEEAPPPPPPKKSRK
ncbi:high mobility group box domain-containing protein, partial [Suillus clintonianus]|uniref:high mobility group box domain-containing protein n=1 Tax=Suillus clintonianus TaxID=1904413 RepID=UPI001B85F8BE